jgi:hypothetical protein
MEEKKEEKGPELTLIEKAEIAAKRIEEANKKTEELLRRQEEIATKALLGGKSDAGQAPPPPKTPQEIAKDEAREYLKGTGLDPFK